jgi:hypothetical protein
MHRTRHVRLCQSHARNATLKSHFLTAFQAGNAPVNVAAQQTFKIVPDGAL